MRTVVRGAALPTADDATVSAPNPRSRVSLIVFSAAQLPHDTILDRRSRGQSHSNSSLRAKLGAASNSICGSDGSVQHAKPSLRGEMSLAEQRLTHKILDTCDFPHHFLIVDCNSIQRHSTDGMRLRLTPQHKCCEMKLLNAAHVKNHEKNKVTRNAKIITFYKLRRERSAGWLLNAKKLLIGTCDRLPLTSTCLCLRNNEWNSAFAGSVSDPLTQPTSSRPTTSCRKR